MNHDCRPNAAYFFDPDTLTHYVHAITTIHPGEEVTVTYIDALKPREERRSILSSTWGFDCSCSLCTQHSSLTSESDTRIAQILGLSEDIEEDAAKASTEAAMALVALLQQERLHAWLSGAYTMAALAFSGVGEKWNTIRYARVAIEVGMLDNGFDDEDVVVMRELAKEPEKHWSWLQKVKRDQQLAKEKATATAKVA